MFWRILQIGLLATLIGFWILMAVLTHMPRAPVVPEMTDKTAHFIGFGTLGLLLYLTIWTLGRATPWTGLFVLVVVGLYGALDELTQPLTGRHCSFMDWMANMSGVATAVVVVGMAHWGVTRRGKRAEVLGAES